MFRLGFEKRSFKIFVAILMAFTNKSDKIHRIQGGFNVWINDR